MNPLTFLGAPALLLARTVWASAREGLSWRECLRQLNELGARSLWLVTSGMAFFGVVLVTFADSQARKVTGNLPVVGPPYFELLVREFGPAVSALLAAARGGAGTSAELSTMSVHEQVEALEMSAGDPYADLVAPRVVAGVVGVPLLCIVGTMAATLSAVATASWVFEVDGRAFMDARFVTGWDVLSGLAKGVGCGLYIPLAASMAGLSARGGAEAVGEATTRGVVAACFGCLLIDFLVAFAFQVLGI